MDLTDTPLISLDIFADPVCPFCYLGFAQLRRALEANPNHRFALRWHPFQLNPTLPPEGMDRRAYLEGLFGSKAEVARAHVPVLEMAEELGLPLNLETITRTPNTLDAHRLVHWAELEGRATPVMAALMRAYWAEGRDIGARAVLIEIGEAAGLARDVLARLFASDADLAEIKAREDHARARGIRAVPSFIIDNAHVLSGAQPARLWGQIIVELDKE